MGLESFKLKNADTVSSYKKKGEEGRTLMEKGGKGRTKWEEGKLDGGRPATLTVEAVNIRFWR